ncbi:hypothetical protein [Paenibacillus sp. Leaf72]|uniref:hypothetical protein n=1 Tax=Paenibacillus sp. Leaf72 TaxID=1736234 RepID=UPI0006FD7A11|nr:hypothetical protein [Paenibacillus sp. Leaf72]KQN96937.1 hypothetical protein ASF12_22980 [Paenibacillus sp. Leaf72]
MLGRIALDEIWDKALEESLCACSNDNKWGQDITGFIYCENCKSWIVKPTDFDDIISRKATITMYDFEEAKGLSGVLMPDGTFLKCGNAEHNLVLADIPLDVQFGCLYFSSRLTGERDGNITHSSFQFQGVTIAQLDWINDHYKFYDEGQKRFNCHQWARKLES